MREHLLSIKQLPPAIVVIRARLRTSIMFPYYIISKSTCHRFCLDFLDPPSFCHIYL